MNPAASSNKKVMIMIVVLVAAVSFAVAGWFGYSKFLKKDYSRPWWNDTTNVRACEVKGDDCYEVMAHSDRREVNRVTFPPGAVEPSTDLTNNFFANNIEDTFVGFSECEERSGEHVCSFYTLDRGIWELTALE